MSNKIVVKGYRLGPIIDQSGLKVTYRAVSQKTNEEVFITVISVRPGRSLNILEKRAKQSQQLALTNLLSADEFGTLPNNFFYYVHPAIPTRSLDRMLDEIFNEEERLFKGIRVFMEMIDIVDYIHEAQGTHRDLTTQNVRIDQKGKVLLEGFINARPKIEGRNIANIVHMPYIAPEQLTGHSADRKTDIYSLGIILYEIVTGTIPYTSNYAKIQDARQGIAPNPSIHKMGVPSDVEAIIVRALTARGSRYKHVREMQSDLEAFYDTRSLRLKFRDFTASLKSFFTLSA